MAEIMKEQIINSGDDKFFSAISKILSSNERFKQAYAIFGSEYSEYCYATLQSINKIMLDIDKRTTTQIINDRDIRIQIREFYEEINKRNVQAAIIHVQSKISDDQKNNIIEKILNELPPMPNIIFKNNSENKVTLIEIIFFGINISKVQLYDEIDAK